MKEPKQFTLVGLVLRSSYWTEGKWIVAIKRPEPKTKETTL